jgi:probable phosphoglycerate mutase
MQQPALATQRGSENLHSMQQANLRRVPTTLILCRHGESEGNCEARFGGQGPTPLTARGRVQARAAGNVLAGSGVDAVYTSDLPRAAETAALIGESVGLQARPTRALRERCVGELTGLTFDEARVRFPDAFAALMRREANSCPPGGETYTQCRARAASFLDRAMTDHAGGRVLMVSHNLTLMQLIMHLLKIEASAQSAPVLFQADNCAFHRFELGPEGSCKVVALNERAHLG